MRSVWISRAFDDTKGMSALTDSTMLGISLIENIVLEKPEEISAICAVMSVADAALLVQFFSTAVAELLVEQHGLTGAVEALDSWRHAALAGAP